MTALETTLLLSARAKAAMQVNQQLSSGSSEGQKTQNQQMKASWSQANDVLNTSTQPSKSLAYCFALAA